MILIALGANLESRYGAPEATFEVAVARMADAGIETLQRSSVWLTAPVPVSDQPWYRNAVVAVATDLQPRDLLRVLKGIEVDMGREAAVRNAPRVIDLDIIAYNDVVWEEDGLQIPHIRAHERAFVLYPLKEIVGEVAPDWVHPVLKLDLDAMIHALPAEQEIKKLEDEVA